MGKIISIKIVRNDEICRDAWRIFLESNEFASPFQTIEYFDLINSVNGLSAQALGVTISGELQALVVVTIQRERGMKNFFSRRAIIYGGPLVNTGYPEALQLILKEIHKTLINKVIYIEVRNSFSYKIFFDTYKIENWTYHPYLNLQLRIIGTELDLIKSNFSYNRRREIRQSIENETIYFETRNEDQIVKIYEILKQNYLSRVNRPLPELDFFIKFYRSGLMKVFSVMHDDKIIGGSFCPFLEKKGLYTLYYCGLRHYHKKIFPTHLAILAAIEYCINNYIPLFDFMGAGRPQYEYGVRRYKTEFGGELVENGRFTKILNPILYKIGEFGLWIISKKKE